MLYILRAELRTRKAGRQLCDTPLFCALVCTRKLQRNAIRNPAGFRCHAPPPFISLGACTAAFTVYCAIHEHALPIETSARTSRGSMHDPCHSTPVTPYSTSPIIPLRATRAWRSNAAAKNPAKRTRVAKGGRLRALRRGRPPSGPCVECDHKNLKRIHVKNGND